MERVLSVRLFLFPSSFRPTSDRARRVVSAVAGDRTLSIWDPKASEFSSGEQFSLPLPCVAFPRFSPASLLTHGMPSCREPAVALAWSLDDRLLAVATASQVDLFCAQRLDDLSGAASWNRLAAISAAECAFLSFSSSSELTFSPAVSFRLLLPHSPGSPPASASLLAITSSSTLPSSTQRLRSMFTSSPRKRSRLFPYTIRNCSFKPSSKVRPPSVSSRRLR
jgi:hypothetical protein